MLRFLCAQEWATQITGADQALETVDVSAFPQRNLFVLMSTDKGLCGGVNSILCRMTRQMLAKLDAAGKEYKLLVLGEKGRAIMRRTHGDKFVGTFTDRALPYSFDLAAAAAAEVVAQDFDSVHLLFNRFKSAIAYTATVKSITPMVDPNVPYLWKYDFEPANDSETLLNFFEYTLACQTFHGLMENATSEQSSRMTAMENASKNAEDMISKLTLQYNRARQTRITTELIEIISGASALESKK